MLPVLWEARRLYNIVLPSLLPTAPAWRHSASQLPLESDLWHIVHSDVHFQSLSSGLGPSFPNF